MPEDTSKKPKIAMLRPGWDTGQISALSNITAIDVDLEVFTQMRLALPFLDRAIRILTLLDGWIDLDMDATDEATAEILEEFMTDCPLNSLSRGFQWYVHQMTDQALTKGFSVGEMVVSTDLDYVAMMQIAKSETMRFVNKEGQLTLAQIRSGSSQAEPLEADGWLDLLAFDQRDGHPQGLPLAVALPETTAVMLRVRNCLRNNWWRLGNLSYHWHLNGGEGQTLEGLGERMSDFQDEFEEVIKAAKQDQVADLFTYGLMGDEYKCETFPDAAVMKAALEIADPTWKMCAEELIGATGIPAWVLGPQWSTTERLSTEQAKVMITEVNNRRRMKTHLINRNFRRVLALHGKPEAEFAYKWRQVSFHDAVENARVYQMKAHADKARAETAVLLDTAGLADEDRIEELVSAEQKSAKTAGTKFAKEEHRNPRIREFVAELTTAGEEIALDATDALLMTAGLPSIDKIEAWEDSKGALKRVREMKWRKAVRMPTEEQFGEVFDAWYKNLCGESAMDLEAPYPAFSLRCAGEAARYTHEELGPQALTAGVTLKDQALIMADDSYVRAFTRVGQARIEAKLSITFKNRARQIIAQGMSGGESAYGIGAKLNKAFGRGSAYHWDRLARSEGTKAADLGNWIEGRHQGVKYEKWIFMGGDCEICGPLANRVWKFGRGPRPVSDTHPNCACDKQLMWVYEGDVQDDAVQSEPYELYLEAA